MQKKPKKLKRQPSRNKRENKIAMKPEMPKIPKVQKTRKNNQK